MSLDPPKVQVQLNSRDFFQERRLQEAKPDRVLCLHRSVNTRLPCAVTGRRKRSRRSFSSWMATPWTTPTPSQVTPSPLRAQAGLCYALGQVLAPSVAGSKLVAPTCFLVSTITTVPKSYRVPMPTGSVPSLAKALRFLEGISGSKPECRP